MMTPEWWRNRAGMAVWLQAHLRRWFPHFVSSLCVCVRHTRVCGCPCSSLFPCLRKYLLVTAYTSVAVLLLGILLSASHSALERCDYRCALLCAALHRFWGFKLRSCAARFYPLYEFVFRTLIAILLKFHKDTLLLISICKVKDPCSPAPPGLAL